MEISESQYPQDLGTHSQFTLKLFWVAISSVGFSIWLMQHGTSEHLYLFACSIPAFWAGMGLVLLGGIADKVGEKWAIWGVIVEVVGCWICVVSVFTGLFSLGGFLLEMVIRVQSS